MHKLQLYKSHYPFKHFYALQSAPVLAVTVGLMEANVVAYLHPAALQRAFASNEGTQHIGGLPPLATHWQ